MFLELFYLGILKEDRTGRPAYDPGQSEEGRGDQTVSVAQQSKYILISSLDRVLEAQAGQC